MKNCENFFYRLTILPFSKKITIIVLTLLLLSIPLTVILSKQKQTISLPPFIASVDTMKESMDTANDQLTNAQIADDVNLTATLNTTHITVDTFYNYPEYMQRWVNAVRKTGKHVWFRTTFKAWVGQNGAEATMTPAQYIPALQTFILAHPSLFQPGDIFDPCPEPEDSSYWEKRWGAGWSWQNAPNAGTDEYNKFILDLTNVADNALHQQGMYGVITTIHSMNGFFWERPTALYDSTLQKLGVMAIDTYPDNTTTDPATAAKARVDELTRIYNVRHVPIINAELGYNDASNYIADDTTQDRVLKAELDAISKLDFIIGMNYWVGAGSAQNDGTRLFNGSAGHWTPRPSAYTVAAYYASKLKTASSPGSNEWCWLRCESRTSPLKLPMRPTCWMPWICVGWS